MPDYGGYADLGKTLFGGGASTQKAYNSALESGARVESLLATAKINRDKAMAREKFRDSAVAAGVPPEQADLLSTTFGAGYNPEQLSGYQGDRQKMGLTDEAATAARGGSIDELNNLMTVLSGKPRERTAITGGMAYDAYAAPDQAMTVTPVGQSDIRATDALAGQREAGEQSDLAHAALYGRTDPNLRGTGSAAKPAAYTAPAAANLAAVLGGDEGAASPELARDFSLWRTANPQYRNGEEALAAYIAETGSKGPIIIDPSMPGSMTRKPPALLDRVFSGAPGDQTDIIEREIGRPLSQQERAAIASGTLNLQAPARPAAPVGPPPQAVAFLRANPGMAAQFEAKYGVPAAQYLGR